MTTIGKLTILGPAPPDKHGRRWCGFSATAVPTSLSHARLPSNPATRNPADASSTPTRNLRPQRPARCPEPLIGEGPPALTPAWYAQQIAGKEAAAVAAERRANDLEEKLATQECTDLETHKQWNTEATTARKLRQEIARLKSAKDKAETGEKKDTRTQVEITRDKIAALRGGR